jgi:hypothetical protein
VRCVRLRVIIVITVYVPYFLLLFLVSNSSQHYWAGPGALRQTASVLGRAERNSSSAAGVGPQTAFAPKRPSGATLALAASPDRGESASGPRWPPRPNARDHKRSVLHFFLLNLRIGRIARSIPCTIRPQNQGRR